MVRFCSARDEVDIDDEDKAETGTDVLSTSVSVSSTPPLYNSGREWM